MKKKPKTLGRFLTKKYLTTSLLLLFLISLFIAIAQFFVSGTNEMVEELCAQTIVRPDYKKIDIATLKDVGGWVEILDEKNDVIYTKGKVAKKSAHYTQNQLLEMDALQSMISHKTYLFGPITFKFNDPEAQYMATFAPFTGSDGRNYICLAKVPRKSIRGNFNLVFDSFSSPTFLSNLKDRAVADSFVFDLHFLSETLFQIRQGAYCCTEYGAD